MRFIILILFVITYTNLRSQEVVVYDRFDDFEEMLNRDDGNTYVINFWATWCAPCIKELPFFEAIHEEYGDENVTVVLVSLDFKEHLERKVLPFIDKKGLKSRIVLMDDPNANSWIDRVDKTWSGAIPATVIYSKKGRIFMEHEFSSFKELEEVVLSIK